ncbi:glucokinase [Cladophialophora psammophila CBS 110553]|uniref:Phosphotransferase n=1 Tax=Cladophialophora psammophila CBS 110553 TaxID=1182543 RepID=W9WDL5_9EURO|nr:glucokinase [Cladophialophora psammophila CBS 110553]EXJ66202.1 glucokinase [Cladophialophora psammophila CBS 110553]
MALEAEAKHMVAQFEYTAEDVNKGVKEFIREMEEGLEKQGTSISQIPTYVTSVPNGTEKGVYLAVDLGGTNFRVCSITLHGNQSFSLQQTKVAVPRALMEAKTAHELFSFLAKQIESFLKAHHMDHFETHKNKPGEVEFFDLGFTFSFPVNQVGINKGRLMRWTKGFNIEEAIGQDVCGLLQKEIDALNLPVRVAALVNDTVGTLMARSYTSPGKTSTLIGAIFGTGTNGAYVEKLERVKKMKAIDEAEGGVPNYDSSTGLMVINTEWGSFDNALSVLPNTQYDIDLDRESVNPGIQMFEKRVSGMFLGEILRRALLSLYKHPDAGVALFKDTSSLDNDIRSTTTVADDSPLFKTWGIDTSFLSIVEEDHSDHLRITKQTLEKDLKVEAASTEDCVAVKMLVHAIGKRAARLSAVALAGVIISTNKLQEDEIVDVGVDGSLVEYYPGFEEYIREAFREIEGIGEDEKRIRIGLAKDGSGLGAALIALVAHNADQSM